MNTTHDKAQWTAEKESQTTLYDQTQHQPAAEHQPAGPTEHNVQQPAASEQRVIFARRQRLRAKVFISINLCLHFKKMLAKLLAGFVLARGRY